MIYRVIQRLSVGTKISGYVEPGATVSDADLGYRVATILVKKGAISPVSAPPLNVLPGWKLRAEKFMEAGYDAITLLECDAELIARETGYSERSIKKWKKELMEFLEVKWSKARSGCGGCGKKSRPEPKPEPEVEPEIQLKPGSEFESSEFESLESDFELIEKQEQIIEEVTGNATDE